MPTEDAGVHNTIGGGIQIGPVMQGRDFSVTVNQAVTAPVALAQLPPRPTVLTGRDSELREIQQVLRPASQHGTVVVSAVGGIPGVGKTALALAAGHEARDGGLFRGGALFIDLHGYDAVKVEPHEALDALLRALGVTAENIPPTTEGRGALYRSILNEIEEPVLIIADNASSEAQVRPLLPGTGHHRTVVTSRRTLARLDARLLDLSALNSARSVELLDTALRIARPDDNRVSRSLAKAGEIAELCGGLPLALQIVAAVLKTETGMDLAELTTDLKDRRLELLEFEDGSDGAGLSVTAAFELSYRALDPAAATLFCLMSVNPGSDISTEALSILAETSASSAVEIIRRLVHAHLVRSSTINAGHWQIQHDLLRLYAEKICTETMDQDQLRRARLRLLDFYCARTGAAAEVLRTTTDDNTTGPFASRSEALDWLDAERASLIPSVGVAVSNGDNEIAIRLAAALAPYLEWRRRFEDQLATSATGLQAARAIADRGGEGNALIDIGIALRETMRHADAIEACRAAAEIFHDLGDRVGEGTALNNLANALAEAGLFDEAIEVHNRDLILCRESEDQMAEARGLSNLGLTYFESGRLDEAAGASEQAADLFHTVGDRYGEAMSLNTLGLCLTDSGQLTEALNACRRAEAIFTDIDYQRGIGLALNSIGRALLDLGQVAEAIDAHRRHLEICRDANDKYDAADALDSLSLALQAAGRMTEAIDAGLEALKTFREIGNLRGEDKCLNYLPPLLEQVGRHEEASSMAREAQAVSERLNGTSGGQLKGNES
jgi:tetratricopeptide (TPR) repeat protein